MELKALISGLSKKEPLNPYQIAGITAVIEKSGVDLSSTNTLEVAVQESLYNILDRSGGEAAPYLVRVSFHQSTITLYPQFSHDDLEKLQFITSFLGRKSSIKELLIPALADIPNWVEPVNLLAHYAMDRDDESLSSHLPEVMSIILSFLFAAAKQPFDQHAKSEAEFTLFRLLESIFKNTESKFFAEYTPYIGQIITFLKNETLPYKLNTFERRLLSLKAIQATIRKIEIGSTYDYNSEINILLAAAVRTALSELQACPDELIVKFQSALDHENPEIKRFLQVDVLDKVKGFSALDISSKSDQLQEGIQGQRIISDEELVAAVDFVRSPAAAWKSIFTTFNELSDRVPPKIQEIFSEILAYQILAIEKPDVRQLLIDGLCNLVISLEKTKKKASQDMVHAFTIMFLDSAYSGVSDQKTLAALNAIEALGTTLGRANYHLMAQELIELLIQRPLISPGISRFSLEDDDTGEPLVLAEEVGVTKAHVQHIKTLISIIASNPRIMHKLIPYLIVQIEIGTIRIRDEDFIQFWISKLLRSNCEITHFLIRTLVKAIPYSFKDIGPLDTLRLTAAGLAKELSNRGVKPIGNFLGKLRGDIHWRGSIENFYFSADIMKYFKEGNPERLSEWMPKESLAYMSMEQWCSADESQSIRELSSILIDQTGLDVNDKQLPIALVSVNSEQYRYDTRFCEFARKMVLDIAELIKGLHRKYFISPEDQAFSGPQNRLIDLSLIIQQRSDLKDQLTRDIHDPMPESVTLTEGVDDHVTQIDKIRREQPSTPIILFSKKTGHAYAQKASYIADQFELFTKDLALEARQETLATTLNNTDFDVISFDILPDALDFLDHLIRGVAVNGHSSYYLLQAGRDLRRAGHLGLTLDKVRDVIGIVKKELDDIHAVYRSWFEEPFDNFLTFCPMDKLPRKLKDLTTLKEIPDTDFYKNYLKTLYLSDLQARDGNLRVLETFIDKVELFLTQRLADSGRRVSKKPKSSRIVPFYFPDTEEISPCRIGLKASLLRFAENTPPYFVITTDQQVTEPEAMISDSKFRKGLAQSIEKLGSFWGRSLGDPENPALFSVRSGSRISMPGMMITITNVGINDQIAEALAQKVGPWFAYDCYRRFLQEFSQSVFGVERDEFQEIIDLRKAQLQIMRKAQLSADQMKNLAFEYKKRVGELAPKVVEMLDEGRFLDILIYCASVVLNSYDGHAAKKYREAAGIHGNWRTPVIIQAMVYGNMELTSSGTGVVSYNPFTLDLRGDFAQGDQGTDVVDGKVPTIPAYDVWKTQDALATRMPDAWKKLSGILFRTAEFLHFDTRLEYTIENGIVFILQIRKDRERRERIPSLISAGYNLLAEGTGVSGKIFRGIMVTDRNQIAPFRHINKAQSIIDSMNERLPESEKLDGFIFVVNDPIPEEIMEDVFGLPVPTALISRQGGHAAHAADIAKSLGKTYVGQVRQIVKFSGKPESICFQDQVVVVGSKMVIHGQTGEIALYSNSGGNRVGDR